MGGPHVYRELAAHPDQLGGVGLQLLDAAGVGLAHVDGIPPEGIDDLEVVAKHVRVLVVLGADVLLDGGGQRELRAPPEGDRDDVGPGRAPLVSGSQTGRV